MTKTYCATDDGSTKSYEELKANLARLEAQVEGKEPDGGDKGGAARLIIETCHQVKANGRLCGSPAAGGRHYCHFHLDHRARRLAMARARARGQRWRLQLPPLENLASVQVALMQVLDAVTDDSIDPRRAGLLLYGLQQASSNLRGKADDWLEDDRFESDKGVECADLEAKFGLPADLDLATPPEVAFPPPEAEQEQDELSDIGAQRLTEASDAEVRRQQKRLEHARQLALTEARNAERKAERIEAACARWAAEAAAREQAGGDGVSSNPKKAPQGVPEAETVAAGAAGRKGQ